MIAPQEAPNPTFPAGKLTAFFGKNEKGHPRVHVAEVTSGLDERAGPIEWSMVSEREDCFVLTSRGVVLELVRQEGNIFDAKIGFLENPRRGEISLQKSDSNGLTREIPVHGVTQVIFLSQFNKLIVNGDVSTDNGARHQAEVKVDLAGKKVTVLEIRETTVSLQASQR